MTIQSWVAEAPPASVESPYQSVSAEPDARPSGWAKDRAIVLAVFVGYAGLAAGAWGLFDPTLGPAFFYPSAGITVAAFVLSRRALWPAIAGAIALAELAVDILNANPIGLSLVYVVSNVAEPLLGATLVLAWCRGRPDLRRRSDFKAFILGACLAGPALGGLIGGSAKAINGGFPWLSTVSTWASGDALGVLVVAAPILLWADQAHILRRRSWETVGTLMVTGALAVGTYWSAAPEMMFVLPVLAWAAFRLDMLGAALAGAVAAFLSNFMTARGYGVFANYDASPALRLWLNQAYIATITVVAMLIALEAGARLRAVREREAERQERLRLESLSRLAHQLSVALTADDIGHALVGQLVNEFGAHALTMGLLSEDSRRLDCVTMVGFPQPVVDRYAGAGMPMSQSAIATDVVRSGAPVEFHSLADYQRAYPDTCIVADTDDTESIVAWPLSYSGKPFGVLLLLWPGTELLDGSKRSYISAVATMVSQSLVRAKIYADQHARAAVLHSVAQPVAQVHSTALEYRALYRPSDTANGLGGDWYSVMALPDRRTYLAVGDVIGHGLASVEDMARLRTTGDAYAHQGLSPAQILTELNRFASHQIQGEFATNVVAVFDPDDFSLTYGCAGHLPALLRRAETGEVIRLSEPSGAILGPFEDSVYEQRTVQVEPGDVLVMYTDGLVEYHEAGLMAGIAQLEQVLATHEALPDCEALAREVARPPYQDDICLLAVRFG